MGTLVWALTLLFVLMYVFAIGFMSDILQHVSSARETGKDDEATEFLLQHFSSIYVSVSTLFFIITSGVSWAEFFYKFRIIDNYLPLWLCAYVAFALFGLFNIITSIVLESALEVTRNERELLVTEVARKREVYTEHIKVIFQELDVSNVGHVSLGDICELLADPNTDLYDYFEALQIDAASIDRFFKSVDIDKSGYIDIGEFLDGCLRFKGPARNYDVQCMIEEIRTTRKTLQQMAGKTESLLRFAEEMNRFRRTCENGLSSAATLAEALRRQGEMSASYPPVHQISASSMRNIVNSKDVLGKFPEEETPPTPWVTPNRAE